MGQPNFYSSSYALANLLIGLGRGYHKELRRLKRMAEGQARRRGGDPDPIFVPMRIELDERFVEDLIEGLGDYYPSHKQDIAGYILLAIRAFQEQR